MSKEVEPTTNAAGENLDTTDSVAVPTASTQPEPSPASPEGGQPVNYQALYTQAEQKRAEYETRFKGLQGTLQREVGQRKDAQAKIAELEATVASFDTERDSMQTQLTEFDDYKSRAEQAESNYSRLHTVATNPKYANLLPIFDDLPDGTGEEWEQKLDRLVDHMGNSQSTAVNNALKGSVPGSPTGEPPETAEELLNASLDAFRAGDSEKYNQLYSQYLQAKE